jgi:hypothetical protein
MCLETVPYITAALLTVRMLRLDLNGFKFRYSRNMLTLHKLDTVNNCPRIRIRQFSLTTFFSLSILMNVIFLKSNYFYVGRWFGKFNYVGKK